MRDLSEILADVEADEAAANGVSPGRWEHGRFTYDEIDLTVVRDASGSYVAEMSESPKECANATNIARNACPDRVAQRCADVRELAAEVEASHAAVAQCHEAFALLLDAGIVTMPAEAEQETVNPFALVTNGVRDLLTEVANLRGAMAADDERLHQAAARVELVFGCDTPDVMADSILGLRAEVDRLRAELADVTQQRDNLRSTVVRVERGEL